MPSTWFKSVEVTGPNTIKVGEGGTAYKPVYLPYCPKEGKEKDCERYLEELLAKEDGVSALVYTPFTINAIIHDVRCSSINRPISDMMVERDLAIKWNMPGADN